MKNNNLMLLGIGALALYAISKKGSALDNSTGDYSHEANQAVVDNNPYEAVTVTGGGRLISTPIQNSAQGVNLINSTISSGGRLLPTGRTIVGSGVTFSDAQGNVYRTGANQTVSQLASSPYPVVITVNQPKRDSSGMTALDRVIAKSKAAK